MPKIKTNRAAAKRLRGTKSGKLKRNKAFTRHLKTAKTSKRRRSLRKGGLVSPGDFGRVKRMVPYL
jgi:large subunit ribosomal protein L35